ncbi:DUF6907 domain-containing protein [Streptomyces chrestomyceticus]|nr:hypothetical protein [Streptomyces chrestomyceticus]
MPAAELLPRLAVASVGGVPVRVECPSWCVLDHGAAAPSHLEDVRHEGAPIRLVMPLYNGSETVMVARLSQWPFAPGGGRVYVAVDSDGCDEDAALYRDAALALADQLAAHAADIRRVALQADPAA